MRVDILKYLQMRIGPTLYRRAVAEQVSQAKDCAGPTAAAEKTPAKMATRDKGGNEARPDNFDRKYSPARLLVLLALSVSLCGLLIKYVFLWVPKLRSTDMPLIGSVMLIVFLSPVLYAFFYTPMVRQIDKLKEAEKKMRELALNDVLTGLYNRRGFLAFTKQLLKLSERAQRGLVLIYADLDNLKRINDDEGHEAGDAALISIADVLRKTFRSSDVIGRVGGDEFAVLALEAKEESLGALRKRLKKSLERAKYNSGSMRKLTFSLGIIYYHPERPQTIEELLRRADVLMYEDKNFRTVSRQFPHTVGR